MKWFQSFLQGTPEIALFLSLALGYAVGRIKVWRLSLGGIAGTLIVAIIIGMLGKVTLNDQVKNIAFALFIFTLGFISGPSFFASLNRRSLRYAVFPVIEVTCLLGITAIAVVLLKLDAGTAAGLMGGGATESAVVGTATDAIGKLNLPADQIQTLQGNVGTAYSISYICGLITIVLLTSQIAPALMRIDLREEAVKLWRKIGGGVEDPGRPTALPELVGRTLLVSAADGRTVADVESALGEHASIERAKRGGKPLDVTPSTRLATGDVILVLGRRESLLDPERTVGPEVASQSMDFDLDVAQVLVTGAKGGITFGALRAAAPPESHGVFLTGVSRMDHQLPLQDGTQINSGDVVRLTGASDDVATYAKRIGFRLDTGVKADFVFLSVGVVLGFLIGKVELTVGSIPLSLGTGGGCLLSGLLFGWLRAKHPTFGQYDPAAASVIKDLGLATFICAVGLSSGPQAVGLIQKFGLSLPLTGILMTLVPACISLFVSWKVMKLPAPLALGAVAGQQCSTPAITAVQGVAGNATPLMSYTIVYALSNVVLPLLGPIVVGMARALG
ncbi:aspartate-alanine antiporter [Actinocorallia sp. A-T 12471]|uniref:aspartate-alanine antiporter n=1 Tax=Actinocorallia sp. A-T 12471 TaxID=3089813 RepID=UPI0029CE9BF5|nr:aspartate-alanine antiporter [Actinocorallia sp. A-T 12471]MDX6742257.1 aspartate-alanine antiporter [Actinocorallia sp. A-T 12471]